MGPHRNQARVSSPNLRGLVKDRSKSKASQFDTAMIFPMSYMKSPSRLRYVRTLETQREKRKRSNVVVGTTSRIGWRYWVWQIYPRAELVPCYRGTRG